jgi:hypothetical protein
MACCLCLDLDASHSDRPFFPADADRRPFVPGDLHSCRHPTFVCPCGQRWYCFCPSSYLWVRINSDDAWQNILAGCPQPLIIT